MRSVVPAAVTSVSLNEWKISWRYQQDRLIVTRKRAQGECAFLCESYGLGVTLESPLKAEFRIASTITRSLGARAWHPIRDGDRSMEEGPSKSRRFAAYPGLFEYDICHTSFGLSV